MICGSFPTSEVNCNPHSNARCELSLFKSYPSEGIQERDFSACQRVEEPHSLCESCVFVEAVPHLVRFRPCGPGSGVGLCRNALRHCVLVVQGMPKNTLCGTEAHDTHSKARLTCELRNTQLLDPPTQLPHKDMSRPIRCLFANTRIMCEMHFAPHPTPFIFITRSCFTSHDKKIVIIGALGGLFSCAFSQHQTQ